MGTTRQDLLKRLGAAQDEHPSQDIITIVYCRPVMTDEELEQHVRWYERPAAGSGR